MNNEEDYIELYKLLAKCKFYLSRERSKLNINNINHSGLIHYYEKKLKQIDEFMEDVPIIIEGEQ